ncbi:hypothetical protein PBOI14_17840 [Pseudomonas sp. Boi14]|nr:hypothetical protein PBOI14_17840 [Pseudomonas sp. Boi14]
MFGTNPLAFAWPRPGGQPFVFDFATSAIARGDIELHARQGKPIPEHWAIDADGQPTTDAKAALQGAMQTFGGHKGSALAAMIELLAGALIGDLTSAESMAFDGGVGATPCHGELVLAFDPRVFLGRAMSRGWNGRKGCSRRLPGRAHGCRHSGVLRPGPAAWSTECRFPEGCWRIFAGCSEACSPADGSCG